VTIAAEPTYAVTFADGVNPEPPADPEWTVSPNTDVKKGQTVTVTYTGTRKVIGVKAEKKAVGLTYPVALSAVTADYLGSVVTSDGNVYPAKTDVPAGKTAVGVLGKVTETGHGLILALQDAEQQNWSTINFWASASYAGTTLKVLPDDAARGTNLTSYTTLGETTVSNWAVAQLYDYKEIFTNLESTTGDILGKTYDGNVNAYITGAGGVAISGDYWSTSEDEDERKAWYFGSNNLGWDNKSTSYNVRPVLGF
ncbi:MAG: hypothetical protein IIZ44_05360, partial [Muribaculaceae bacterium]|nr:hypothetical protein [Muribaculaceae bacterium]